MASLRQKLLRVEQIDEELAAVAPLYAERSKLMDEIIPALQDRISVFSVTTVVVGKTTWEFEPTFVKKGTFSNNAWRSTCLSAFAVRRVYHDSPRVS